MAKPFVKKPAPKADTGKKDQKGKKPLPPFMKKKAC